MKLSASPARPALPLRRRRRAFTLLELIVVLVVLGLLAAIAIPTYQHLVNNAEETSATSTVEGALRSAVAMAALERQDAPTRAQVQAAFNEATSTATAAGEYAAAGGYTVCEYGSTTCSTAEGATRVDFRGSAERAGVIVHTTPRVLGHMSGNRAVAWVDAGGTILEAQAGPDAETGGTDGLDADDPSYVTANAVEVGDGEGFYMLYNSVTEATVELQDLSGGLALIVVAPLDGVGNPLVGSPYGCDTITRTVIAGTGSATNCPGNDGYDPGVEGSPTGVACSTNCRAQFSSDEPFAVAVFRIPTAWGGVDFTAHAVSNLTP